jgi:hypothetical protein
MVGEQTSGDSYQTVAATPIRIEAPVRNVTANRRAIALAHKGARYQIARIGVHQKVGGGESSLLILLVLCLCGAESP